MLYFSLAAPAISVYHERFVMCLYSWQINDDDDDFCTRVLLSVIAYFQICQWTVSVLLEQQNLIEK